MNNIDLDDGNTLLCPKCGCNNLHHETVEAWNRRRQDEPGVVIRIDGAERLSVTPADVGFAGRRNDVRIRFSCEQCPATPVLLVKQHKGCTYVGWVE